MKTIVLMIGAFYLLLLMTGCAVDNTEYGSTYSRYNSGFTGYTASDAGYGMISNGYGPAFWTPRYYYYNGYTIGSGHGH
jgi:hypothetical protein